MHHLRNWADESCRKDLNDLDARRGWVVRLIMVPQAATSLVADPVGVAWDKSDPQPRLKETYIPVTQGIQRKI